MITGIDSVDVVVTDIEAARAAYASIGLFVTNVVTVPQTGTRRVAVRFGTQALELVQVADAGRASYSYTEAVCAEALARHGEGFATFSLASTDLATDVAQLKGNGSQIGDPLASGPVQIAHFAPDLSELPYLVAAYTLPAPGSSDLPVTGIDAVFVAVHNLREGSRLYRQNLGLDAQGNIIALSGGAISLYESSGPSGLHRLRLRVGDIGAARDYLAKHHIPFETRGAGSQPELWLDRTLTRNAQITLIQG